MSSRIWRRSAAATLAGAAVVTGLVAVAAPTASAQPAEPTTENRAPVSPDQILMMISQEYQTGSGGGQVSKLIDQVITLRSRGIRPSVASTRALAAGLEARPNQGPLIEALQATLVDQRTQFSRQGVQAAAPGAPAPATPGSPHSTMGPNWGPGNPMQQDTPIFQMPGR
ncbi:hypothetical protein [Mycolicibacterium hippocampi]|uniref:Uncharacterized protein n=1 Tax=Mycolicibacterium hippocampi TaxID=659824 RepID=A0A850PKQ7_9MYCO|nr:hypothetical protein [Mycolicibacterium hippocampi]NVN50991.1 hypothetical protein [Mycolicibacterium hippocampi]